MTDREARIRRATAIVERAFFREVWARDQREVWVDVVIDLEPEDVEAGAVALVKEWTNRARPFPSHLREKSIEARRANAASNGNGHPHVSGIGTGCPEGNRLGVDCRHDQAPESTWVSDQKAGLTHCMQHRATWRGLLPDEDPGELPAEKIRQNVEELKRVLAAKLVDRESRRRRP